MRLRLLNLLSSKCTSNETKNMYGYANSLKVVLPNRSSMLHGLQESCLNCISSN